MAKKLAPGGIFVTQSGPCGVHSCKEVFSSIKTTLESVFPRVVPFAQAVFSFADSWGWNMAFSDAATAMLSPEEMDARIAERLTGENALLDGVGWQGITSLSLPVHNTLKNESHVYTVENPKFIPGQGVKTLV